MWAQSKTDKWLEELIRSKADSQLLAILDQPDTFRYQLIYTRIDRDKRNRPSFQSSFLHVDRGMYFNPASMVKMPLALLALEKLNRMKVEGVDKYTTMLTDSSYSGQTAVRADATAENGMPSIAHYIRKIFLVSDNDAYNRLYEFLGQQYINEELRKKGFPEMRITRRFTKMTAEENRHTNAIRFVRSDGTEYLQPAAVSSFDFDFSRQQLIGRAHYDREDKLVQSPMDFTTHNNAPLEDLQRMLMSVLFPSLVPAAMRFELTEDDRTFLLRQMSERISESRYPAYDPKEFYDSYTKFFFFKDKKGAIPPHVRSFNKTGWSYGFLTDVCYIVDFEHDIEYMLSANIYVNKDGVLNDDKYEYVETGYPFFRKIGEIIHRYELERKRKRMPDLSAFKIDYSGR